MEEGAKTVTKIRHNLAITFYCALVGGGVGAATAYLVLKLTHCA